MFYSGRAGPGSRAAEAGRWEPCSHTPQALAGLRFRLGARVQGHVVAWEFPRIGDPDIVP